LRPAFLIIDVQPSFIPPQSLIDGILPSVAAVECHDKFKCSSRNSVGTPPLNGKA
jgi:hypothetical protein